MTDPSDGGEIPLRIERMIKESGCVNLRTERNADGAKISAFRAGGTLACVCTPDDRESFCRVLALARAENIPTAVIGAGTNLLIRDGFHDGLFVSTKGLSRRRAEENRVFAEAGVRFPSLARELGKRGLSLGEELSGIPGSVGGMLRMNASAYGREIGEILISAEVYDRKTDKIRILSREEMRFSYRESILSDPRFVLLSCVLEGRFDTPDNVRCRIGYYRALREKSQPTGVPSLGCYFKRANGRSPGEIIDSCGLKGLSVGGAAVSEKHAAFLVNKGGATASDLVALAGKVKAAVYEKTGILLSEEAAVL